MWKSHVSAAQKGMPGYGELMHAIEEEIAHLLETGEALDIDRLGGLDTILSARTELCRSPFSPLIAHAIMKSESKLSAMAQAQRDTFFAECFSAAPDDLTLLELNSLLTTAVGKKIGDIVFRVLESRIMDVTVSPFVRRAALEGLLRLALGTRSRELRLAGILIDLDSDHAFLLPAIAKALGLVWLPLREDSVLSRLQDLAAVDLAASEACFELGMAQLVRALDATDSGIARSEFERAKIWMDEATAKDADRVDARLYSLALELLLGFEQDSGSDLKDISQHIMNLAFELHAYGSSPHSPAWLGVRNVELANWGRLALTIDALSHKLWEPAWWEPETVIGNELLAIYHASRTVLYLDKDGGIEAIVQPEIEASLLRQTGQLHQVKAWLQRHPETTEVSDLLHRVEERVAQSLQRPTEAAHRRGGEAAITSNPNEVNERLNEIIRSIIGDLHERLPTPLMTLLNECLDEIELHEDLLQNRELRIFISQIIYFSLHFVRHCTDVASATNPMTAYIFERTTEQLPHENRLQDHYATMMDTWMGSLGVEVRRISGGRADVIFNCHGDRFVVEVKRELTDASPDNLFQSYGGQAEEYQNTSARLGGLLVLDLTRRDGTAMHMRDAVSVRRIRREDESAERLLFLFRISGRRLPPSGLTVEASRARNRRVRDVSIAPSYYPHPELEI